LISYRIQAFLEFIAKNFPYEAVLNDTLNVIKHLRSEYGSKDFGFVGFCWGGVLGSKLCAIKDFNAIVLIHYGPVLVEDFKKSQCPIAFLPSREDQDSVS
jgi:dienelactone hydrolase